MATAVVGVDMASAIGPPAKRTLARFAVGMSRELCFFLFRSPMHGFCGVVEVNQGRAEAGQSRAEQRPAPGLSSRLLRRMSR